MYKTCKGQYVGKSKIPFKKRQKYGGLAVVYIVIQLGHG